MHNLPAPVLAVLARGLLAQLALVALVAALCTVPLASARTSTNEGPASHDQPSMSATGLGAAVGDTLRFKRARIGEALSEGRTDWYFSGYAWHAPYAYSSERRRELNEQAWGAGLGRSVIDARGRTHSIYGLVFRSSHFKPQYNLGYAWLTHWHWSGRAQVGLGYTAFVFSRTDIYRGLPIPGILPLASLRYDKLELLASYLPAGHHAGNVGYLIGRFNF